MNTSQPVLSGRTWLTVCVPLVFLVDCVQDGPVGVATFLRSFRQTDLFCFD